MPLINSFANPHYPSRCYPVNTVLVDQKKLEEYLAAHPNALDSSDDSDSGESSDDDRSSSSVTKIFISHDKSFHSTLL